MKRYVLIFSLVCSLIVFVIYMGWVGIFNAEEVKAVNESLLPQVAQSLIVTPTANGSLNEEAPIPPQCYTKTDGKHNPCYTCHQTYQQPKKNNYRTNLRNDGVNQGIYNFSDEGESNSWKNLFVNRRKWLKKITNKQISEYVDQDNYSNLSKSLQNKDWSGFIPDLKNYHLASEAFKKQWYSKRWECLGCF